MKQEVLPRLCMSSIFYSICVHIIKSQSFHWSNFAMGHLGFFQFCNMSCSYDKTIFWNTELALSCIRYQRWDQDQNGLTWNTPWSLARMCQAHFYTSNINCYLKVQFYDVCLCHIISVYYFNIWQICPCFSLVLIHICYNMTSYYHAYWL